MVLHETDKDRAQRNEPSGLPETIFGQTTYLNYCPHLQLLPQMDGEAHYLQEEIEKRIDMKVPVIKVAILVGCFIRTPDDTGKCMKRYFNKYWILNESLFSSMFLEEKEIYDRSMVKLISSHINEWVKIDIDA